MSQASDPGWDLQDKRCTVCKIQHPFSGAGAPFVLAQLPHLEKISLAVASTCFSSKEICCVRTRTPCLSQRPHPNTWFSVAFAPEHFVQRHSTIRALWCHPRSNVKSQREMGRTACTWVVCAAQLSRLVCFTRWFSSIQRRHPCSKRCLSSKRLVRREKYSCIQNKPPTPMVADGRAPKF